MFFHTDKLILVSSVYIPCILRFFVEICQYLSLGPPCCYSEDMRMRNGMVLTTFDYLHMLKLSDVKCCSYAILFRRRYEFLFRYFVNRMRTKGK